MYGGIVYTETGFTVELIKSGPPSFAPNEFGVIQMDVEYQTESRLRIKIHPNLPRYEVNKDFLKFKIISNICNFFKGTH